ncbi:DHH phosphoesterase [Testicularia cyperi]|uniref:DHH phosphoesterase n=1 Tax=Testicularia cyperi TaxID=1882483 RepID=A0A317XF89_9BASI|nr:DHH phosphoesterase [Testicularia cyperi]
MADYQPIYSYEHARAIDARNRSIFRWIALLTFVAASSVLFLTVGDSFTWRPSAEPATHQHITTDTHITSTMTTNSSTATGAEALPLLNDFLTRSKAEAIQHLQAGPSSNGQLTIIMGNEAGDLDSAACAVSLSYLLSQFGAPSGYQLPASKYVALIQSEHADNVLRPENPAAFRASGIDPDNLLCLDDVQNKLGLSLDSTAFDPSSHVAIGLVDHPSLTGPWGGPRASNRDVQIVVDHHEDVGDHAGAKLRIVKSPSKEPVGSASSLVASLFAESFAKAPRSDGLRQVADLLISAIVIDTDNLRPAPRGKATTTDFEAVKILFPVSSFGSPETMAQIRQTAHDFSPFNHTALDATSVEPIQPISPSEETDSATQSAKIILAPYWQILSQSKMAVSHLSGRDLLRRDYKEVDFASPEHADPADADVALKLGFASVPISIVEWLHKDRPVTRLSEATDAKAEVEAAWSAWWKVLDDWMNERKIDIAVMTGSYRVADGEVDAGKHKRELVLAFAPRSLPESKASTLWNHLRKGLEADAHTTLDQTDRRLMLEQPWKGQRLPESAGGKRERVAGIDADGRRTAPHQQSPRWARVYKQANTRANRKIVLPAVISVLKTAASKL